MPTLFKRSNGIYYIIVTDEKGKRRWVSTGHRKKVDALASLLKETPKHEPHKPHILLNEFNQELLDYARKVFSAGTLSVYERSLGQLVEFIGNIPLHTVTPRHVDNFKAHRIQQVKPITVNLELRTIRAAFYTAVRWELIGKNPFAGVKMCEIADRTPVFVPVSDFHKLLDVMPEPWLRDIVITAALTGLRRGELTNLTWDAVDFERRLVRMESHGSFRTKRGKMRLVPLNNQVIDVLLQRLKSQCGEYVFHNNGARVDDGVLSVTFKRRVIKAGLSSRIHFHTLRHTFASWLVQQSASLYEVQKLLGHSSIKVTEVYSHLVPETLHHAVDKISIHPNS